MTSATSFESCGHQILVAVVHRQIVSTAKKKKGKKRNPVLVNRVCSAQQARAWKVIPLSLREPSGFPGRSVCKTDAMKKN